MTSKPVQENLENIFRYKIPIEQYKELAKHLSVQEIKIIEITRAIPFGNVTIHKKKNEVSGFIEYSGTC